ncbi:MAG: hypothetical protein ABIF77_13780, partial [bacterium]
PRVVMLGRVHFMDRMRKVSEERSVGRILSPDELGAVIRWSEAAPFDTDPNDLAAPPEPDALFGSVPSAISQARDLKSLTKDFSDFLYHEERLELYHCPALKLYSETGETERDFLARASQAAREQRDLEVDKLRRKVERQLDRLETRLARERRELDEDKSDYSSRKREEVLSAGETLLGMLGVFGRKRSGGLSSAARKRRMTSSAKSDITESEAEIARLTEEIQDLQAQLEQDAGAIADKWTDLLEEVETFPIKPRRTDIKIDLAALAWLPSWEFRVEGVGGRSVVHRVPASG